MGVAVLMCVCVCICYPGIQLFWFLRRGAGGVNAAVTLCGVDQLWRVPIGGSDRQLLKG